MHKRPDRSTLLLAAIETLVIATIILTAVIYGSGEMIRISHTLPNPSGTVVDPLTLKAMGSPLDTQAP